MKNCTAKNIFERTKKTLSNINIDENISIESLEIFATVAKMGKIARVPKIDACAILFDDNSALVYDFMCNHKTGEQFVKMAIIENKKLQNCEILKIN
jgi:hypothetical protein